MENVNRNVRKDQLYGRWIREAERKIKVTNSLQTPIQVMNIMKNADSLST
jgi:hypothetical protein